MLRTMLPVVFAVLFLAGEARTQQDGPKVLGKTSIEWMQILEKDEREKFRKAAVIALEVFGAGERGVVQALTEAVERDKSPAIRLAAVRALGSMGADAKSSILTLRNILNKDNSPEVREAAARALGGKMVPHSKVAIAELTAALKDEHVGTRTAAAAALKDLGSESRVVKDELLRTLKDTKVDRFTRMYIAQTVSQFVEDAASVVPVLTAILQEPGSDPTLQQVAVDGLANFGENGAPATSALVDLFVSKKTDVLLRQSAAVTLAKIRPACADVWPVIKTAMGDPEKIIRAQAIRLAAAVCPGNTELVSALIERCRDSSPEVQLAAIQELGELGDFARDAAPTLANIAQGSSRRTIREAAQEALKKVRGN